MTDKPLSATLAELEALLEKATPGEWHSSDRFVSSRPNGYGDIAVCQPDNGQDLANAVLIAKAINALPELIAAAKAMLDEIEALRKERDELATMIGALDVKLSALSPHGSCACSYDAPDHICFHHSPQLSAALAERDEARRQCRNYETAMAPTFARAEAAEAEVATLKAFIKEHLPARLDEMLAEGRAALNKGTSHD